MEIQIQDLVASIKREGIEEAQKQASEIVSQAEAQARDITDKASQEAQKILSDANKEIEILRQSAMVSIQQAKRDALLSLKEELRTLFDGILGDKLKDSVDDKVLADLLKAALNGEDPASYQAEVSSVSDSLRAGLAREIENGLEIKASKQVQFGFRLVSKDGSGFFDFSDEAVEEMLRPFLGNLKV